MAEVSLKFHAFYYVLTDNSSAAADGKNVVGEYIHWAQWSVGGGKNPPEACTKHHPNTTIRRFSKKTAFMCENAQSTQNPDSIKQSQANFWGWYFEWYWQGSEKIISIKSTLYLSY